MNLGPKGPNEMLSSEIIKKLIQNTRNLKNLNKRVLKVICYLTSLGLQEEELQAAYPVSFYMGASHGGYCADIFGIKLYPINHSSTCSGMHVFS